jgi:hypothetical protein
LVETRDKSGGTCREKLNVHWTHPESIFATNWKYLLEAIQDMESPNISLLFGVDRGKQKSPILIQEDNYYAIINQYR